MGHGTCHRTQTCMQGQTAMDTRHATRLSSCPWPMSWPMLPDGRFCLASQKCHICRRSKMHACNLWELNSFLEPHRLLRPRAVAHMGPSLDNLLWPCLLSNLGNVSSPPGVGGVEIPSWTPSPQKGKGKVAPGNSCNSK